MRSLIDIQQLSVEEIDELIAVAEDIIANPAKYQDACRHKLLATLFFEPSTRTRLSFESAMHRLGGAVVGFSEAGSSSSAKGESPETASITIMQPTGHLSSCSPLSSSSSQIACMRMSTVSCRLRPCWGSW